MELLERKSFDLEDYVQDVYNLLSDSEHLKAHLPPDSKLDSNLDYLKRLTDKNREKNNLDYFKKNKPKSLFSMALSHSSGHATG